MTAQIVKFLAWIGFKQAIQDYCFKHQSKSYKDNMKYAFTDLNGKKYYYFPELRTMPLPLLEKLNELQEQLRSKMPGTDLDNWIKAVEKVLNSDSKNKVTEFGYWIGVIKERRNILYDPTVLTEIAALLYIREDENPCVYNSELHREKFTMLWEDTKQGQHLYDFFQQAGLKAYIPSGSITKENWNEYLEQIMPKIQAFNSAITRISILGSEFEKLENNLKTT